jgi:hypothetical protein
MSIWTKLAPLIGIRRPDFSSRFPATLHTPSGGRFNLQRSVLTVDDKVSQVFCSYEAANGGPPPVVVFKPDTCREADVQLWIGLIDRRVPEIVASWRQQLLTSVAVIDKRAQNYLRGGVSSAELIHSLGLSTIVLSSDGSFGLRFETSPALGHCDLGVDFETHGRISHVSIGG